jgi:hypothetical protein
VPHGLGVLHDEVARALAALPDVAGDPTAERALAAVSGLPAAVFTAAGPIGLAAVTGAVLATAAQGVHPERQGAQVQGLPAEPRRRA